MALAAAAPRARHPVTSRSKGRTSVFFLFLSFSKFSFNHHLLISQPPSPSSFFHFLSVTRKKTETKERVRKRPELGGRNTNSSNHSKNSLRSNSFSYFVVQIAFRNPKLNIDSKNLHSSKDLLVRNVFEWFRLGGHGGWAPIKQYRPKSRPAKT